MLNESRNKENLRGKDHNQALGFEVVKNSKREAKLMTDDSQMNIDNLFNIRN